MITSRRHRSLLLFTVAMTSCICGSPSCGPLPTQGGLHVVETESGRRSAESGERVGYTLFVPQASPYLEPPPWPGVILVHGFARSQRQHHGTARYLAERGMVVMTPDLVSLLGGEAARTRNIEIVADHVAWLRLRASTPGDPLEGVLDAGRIALAGHSAGGAICFEVAVDLQQAGGPVQAIGLLDGVPWERTIARGPELGDMPLSSLRSEPSGCNDEGRVLELLQALAFPVEDVKVAGATHCDAEDPSDGLCSLLCGGTREQARAIYQDLVYRFLADALEAPVLEYDPIGYGERLAEYALEGLVERALVAGG